MDNLGCAQQRQPAYFLVGSERIDYPGSMMLSNKTRRPIRAHASRGTPY